MELKGKIALITGGARIGQVVAETLAKEGCHVAMIYRHSKARSEAAAERLKALGVKCLLIQADVSKPEDLERIVPAVEKEFGRLDFLINMASLYNKTTLEDLEKTGPDGRLAGGAAWDNSMNVDARSAYWLALKAAPLMRRHGGGHIVNFSDWLAASGRPRYKEYPTYYIAKATVKSLTEILALELAPGILVNAIAPGPILPPDNMSESERQEVVKGTPLQKWGGPEQIAKTVLFLIQTEFITGECIRVDGGRHLY